MHQDQKKLDEYLKGLNYKNYLILDMKHRLHDNAFKGKCIIYRNKNTFLGGSNSKPYVSDILENPTWLQVAICANRMIAQTNIRSYPYLQYICQASHCDNLLELTEILTTNTEKQIFATFFGDSIKFCTLVMNEYYTHYNPPHKLIRDTHIYRRTITYQRKPHSGHDNVSLHSRNS